MAPQPYGKTILIHGIDDQQFIGYRSAGAYQDDVWDVLHGIENYSKTEAGKLYTFAWRLPRVAWSPRRRRPNSNARSR